MSYELRATSDELEPYFHAFHRGLRDREGGYIPIVIKDACGYGHRDAAERSIASLEFAGDSILTTVEGFCAQLGAKRPAGVK